MTGGAAESRGGRIGARCTCVLGLVTLAAQLAGVLMLRGASLHFGLYALCRHLVPLLEFGYTVAMSHVFLAERCGFPAFRIWQRVSRRPRCISDVPVMLWHFW